ncbi:MAG: ABC transporter ATP-binding protein [Deltaproteobacteria bacterium]|nr:ABC transporter ATP-binding protein [Deltaproteobacteria bacterium]
MISLRGVRKRYPDAEGAMLEVLSGADLSVAEGELVAIVGPSGCGKSTLLNVIGGLDTDYTGEVEVAGQRLTGLSDKALAAFRNRTVGFVFQSFNLLAPLNALENVMLPSFFGGAAASEGQQELEARARAALDRVGLAGKAKRRPPELSGGERQRVAIARALFGRPRLILCDEPTGNLDAKTGAEVIDFFLRLSQEDRQTLVVVTHEERVSKAAGRVLRLREGQLIDGREGAAAP